MVAYNLSPKAAASDLNEIYEYTILNFGLGQAQTYLLELHERFQMLADNPALGRDADALAPKLRRYEYQSHVVFYLLTDQDALVIWGYSGIRRVEIVVPGQFYAAIFVAVDRPDPKCLHFLCVFDQSHQKNSSSCAPHYSSSAV